MRSGRDLQSQWREMLLLCMLLVGGVALSDPPVLMLRRG